MSTYRDPSSDTDATNPLHDAPDSASVVSQQDGHVHTVNAHTSTTQMDKARNTRDC